jgi:folate-dependent phosphoribosylglycinamide formyltransferase PurN
MRVAGLMSGSGTNIRKILEKQRELEKNEGQAPYKMVCLLSDVRDPEKCKIRQIARDYNLDYKINDIWEFYRKRGQTNKRDMKLRREFDGITLEYLKEKRVNCVALGGYMSIVTEVIFGALPTINVHPADLSIRDSTGKRKFTGDHAVRDAILAGAKEIRSSTHIATAEVDGGPLLLISEPVMINLPDSITLQDLKKEENRELLEEITDSHQNQLKEKGDWVIFPQTLLYLAKGLVAVEEDGSLIIDGEPRPDGLKF